MLISVKLFPKYAIIFYALIIIIIIIIINFI